jgi:putative ABC transport system substrate-binding protein
MGIRVQSPRFVTATRIAPCHDRQGPHRAIVTCWDGVTLERAGNRRLLKRRLPDGDSAEGIRAGRGTLPGASLPAHRRRAAHYVDKIFKGGKPANLPVERPTLFELCVNLNTAKTLGLALPLALVLLADDVVE